MSDIQATQNEELAQVTSELGLASEAESDEVFHSSSRDRLPFAFAHRFELVLEKDDEAGLTL